MTDQDVENGSGAEPSKVGADALADTHIELENLQTEISRLETSISVATDGLNLHRSEEELIESLRKRFTYALVIVAAVSLFGINAIAYGIIDIGWGAALRERVDEATYSVATAKMITELALEASKIAVAASKKARKEVDAAVDASNSATKKAEEAANAAALKADSVTNRFTKIEVEIEGASASVRAASNKSISDIQKQLENIQKQIFAVSETSEANVSELQKEQKKLTEKSEEQQEKFTKNGKFRIYVWADNIKEIQSSNNLPNQLTEKFGFNSRSEKTPKSVTVNMEKGGKVKISNQRIATLIVNRSSKINKNDIEQAIKIVLPTHNVHHRFADSIEFQKFGRTVNISDDNSIIQLSTDVIPPYVQVRVNSDK